MPSVVGVFNNRLDVDKVKRRLAKRDIDESATRVIWREVSTPEIDEIEVVRYIDHFEGPGKEAKKGAIGGAIGGFTIGAGSVLLASTGIYLSNVLAPAVSVGALTATAAAAATGAIGGGVTGSAIGALLGAADHDATKVKEIETRHRDVMVRAGFVMIVDDVGARQASRAAAAMRGAKADDVSIVREDQTPIRSPK